MSRSRKADVAGVAHERTCPRSAEGRKRTIVRLAWLMHILALRALTVLSTVTLLGACTPKPASEPETGLIVITTPDHSQRALDFTAEFAKDEGYIHLGGAKSLRTGALHAHQFYRLDAQIIASTPFRNEELQVFFYRSGGPITKPASDIKATATRYREALERSNLDVTIRPTE